MRDVMVHIVNPRTPEAGSGQISQFQARLVYIVRPWRAEGRQGLDA